jgi:hypothetical protein
MENLSPEEVGLILANFLVFVGGNDRREFYGWV